MSLARSAIRIATVMALANGFREPYPTMAGGHVYDTRLDPIEAARDLIPVAIVYTDDSSGRPLSPQNGGPAYEEQATIVIEIAIGVSGGSEDAEDRAGFALPQTEPELELMLDAFEEQVARVFGDAMSKWGAHLWRLGRRFGDWESARYVEREGGIRLASRQIRITAHLPLRPGPLPSANAPAIAEPLGSFLAAIVADAGPYAGNATAMQALLTGALAPHTLEREPLETVHMTEAAHTELNDEDVPRGPRPDGVAQARIPQN